MKKLIIPILIIVGVGGYFGMKSFASGKAEESVETFVDKISKDADVSYKSVDVSPLTQEVTISDVSFTPKSKFGKAETPVEIESLIIHDVDKDAKEDEIPQFLNLTAKGIKMNVDDMGKDGKNLKELGYDGEIFADLDIDYKYDEDEKTLKINELSFGSDEVGELKLNLELENIKLSEDMNIFSLFGVSLVKGSLEYNDHSLMERTMKKQAKEENISVRELKANSIAELEKEIEKAGNSKFAKEALEEIIDFVKDPSKISISINPKNPVNAGSFMNKDKDEIMEELKLKVRA